MPKNLLFNTIHGIAAAAVYGAVLAWLFAIFLEALAPGLGWPLHGYLVPDLSNRSLDDRLVFEALSSGALGALVRFAIRASAINTHMLKTFILLALFVLNIFVGSTVGIFAYFLIRSRFLLKLLYSGEIPNLELTPYGVGIICAFAGLLTQELTRSVVSRFPDTSKDDFLTHAARGATPQFTYQPAKSAGE
jgi:hypothetical protein